MMHHMEIPRCREYDGGQIRVVAKNAQGEQECSTALNVMPKEDWRSKLKQAPKGETSSLRFCRTVQGIILFVDLNKLFIEWCND